MTPITPNKTPTMPQSTPTKPPSAHRVLNTTELLEQILLNLPNQTLLLSQRVNTQFKATIAGSLHLQRKLFFRLAPTDEATNYGDEGVNPLARKVPNLTFTTTSTGHSPADPQMKLTWILPEDFEPPTTPPSWRRMYLKHGPLAEPSILEWGWTEMDFDVCKPNGELTGLGQRTPVPIDPLVVMGAYEDMAVHYLRLMMRFLSKDTEAEEEEDGWKGVDEEEGLEGSDPYYGPYVF